jgi:hypothetical protein
MQRRGEGRGDSGTPAKDIYTHYTHHIHYMVLLEEVTRQEQEQASHVEMTIRSNASHLGGRLQLQCEQTDIA